jgi:hypothetical protein
MLLSGVFRRYYEIDLRTAGYFAQQLKKYPDWYRAEDL